jgi:hypothetical protein
LHSYLKTDSGLPQTDLFATPRTGHEIRHLWRVKQEQDEVNETERND